MVILPPRIQNATASKYYVYSRMQKHNKQRYESPITINRKIEKDEEWKKEKKPKPNFDKPIEKEPGSLGRDAPFLRDNMPTGKKRTRRDLKAM